MSVSRVGVVAAFDNFLFVHLNGFADPATRRPGQLLIRSGASYPPDPSSDTSLINCRRQAGSRTPIPGDVIKSCMCVGSSLICYPIPATSLALSLSFPSSSSAWRHVPTATKPSSRGQKVSGFQCEFKGSYP